MARVDDGGIGIDVENPGGDVVEQLSEISALPRLADTAREQARFLEGNMSEARKVASLVDENSTSSSVRAAIYARISEDHVLKGKSAAVQVFGLDPRTDPIST